ncbi:MAG TPA: TIGR04282 family arsenosugar biosynthesis glycosyltransferase [Xanthobacteraceae bacterium]|nr:TIGR04282 family arsenosugar biosynthesis glycosyltransferase [Xanthobacteraceae bacterium]
MAMFRGSPEGVAVAILAKAPLPGLAKTRLVPALGAAGAAALQARFITRAVTTARSAAIGPVTLWATPDLHHPLFQTIAGELGVALATQPEGDLGPRMMAALAAAGGPAIVVGTDCPALTPEHLRAAGQALVDGIDAVIIPVDDGGYGLIGLRRPQPALFEGMTWSTSSVMAETRRRLARLALSWREPARLWDVDEPADLDRLASAGLGGLMRWVVGAGPEATALPRQCCPGP